MAISLTGDGLKLDYPTSIQTSGGKYPYGCAVVYETLSSISLNGTWAIMTNGGSYSSSSKRAYVGSSISANNSGMNIYVLAVRVA